jgi:excisionase family DNA binding protein
MTTHGEAPTRPATAEVASELEPLAGADQVAAKLGCSVDTVYRYARTLGLPFVKLAGNRKRFRLSAVQRWLDARATVIRQAGQQPNPPATAQAPTPARGPAAGKGARSDWDSELRSLWRRGRGAK